MSRIVLTDIEGTIADIAFVRNVLFPYARKALPEFVAQNATRPAVRAELDATSKLAGLAADDTAALIRQLQAWIDQDLKATPLKALQGMIWKQGYANGDFVAHLYADAHRWLGARFAESTPMYVYSSGSIAAQDLYFRYSSFGDLRHWFDGFFDTTTGPKKEAESYRAISEQIGAPSSQIVFFSDSADELDAAATAGMIAVQICRDELAPCGHHPAFSDFESIDLNRL
jgi:enolase-phosphatase E1